MMALPTMAPRFTSTKNIYEQAIVSRRNNQDHYRQQWNNNSNYFKSADVRSSKLSAWTSDKSFKQSMDSYQALKDKEAKSINLTRRRQKLAKLYEQERLQQQAELTGLSPQNSHRLSDMKERAEGLQSAREEKRKQVAAERLYDHWRLNNPDLRKLESDQHKDHVVDTWRDQVDDNQQRLATARREKDDFEHRAELDRLTAVRKQEEAENAKITTERELKETLLRQMEELRCREEEGRRLKSEEDALITHQWQVDEMERERQRREDEGKKLQFGRLLLKQHVAQLKRKSRLVQQELAQDLELLDSLLKQGNDDSAIRLARREQAKADAAWMKEVLDEQMKVEKAREAEMEMIYQHEASRMWEKREAEWVTEREARQRLMKEVLETRQVQIEARLGEIQHERDESLQQREQLLREMEVANQMTHREQEEAGVAKTARRQQLQQQIQSRREEKEEEDLRLKLDLEEDERELENEEDLLRVETERLRRGGFTHRDVGRRKQAWS